MTPEQEKQIYRAMEKFRKRAINAEVNFDEWNLKDYYRMLRLNRKFLYADILRILGIEK